MVRLDPQHADALHLLGVVAHQKRNHKGAIDFIGRAIAVDATAASYHCNLGVVFRALGRLEDAVDCYREAIRLAHDYAEAHNNLGHALQAQGELDEAIASYRRALQIRPEYADAQMNLANALGDRGVVDETAALYERAVRLNPDDAETRFSRALSLLLSGNFQEGFREYEWRWKGSAADRRFPFPLWDGSDLSNRTILVWAEQGVGDEIMFASCLPDVLQLAGSCVVECDSRLVPLLARSFPEAAIFPRPLEKSACSANVLGNIDVQIALGSLPRFFRTSFESFPPTASYLKPDAGRLSIWRSRLAEISSGLKVGISWRGGQEASVRKLRSTMLDQWSALFAVSDVNFVNLQYGNCTGELSAAREEWGVEIYDWPDADASRDLDDFAAEIAALDLVISVDNSTLHMAASLGVPVWVLIPICPNWRWMRERTESPWYPSVKLYRQQRFGDWQMVFGQLAEDLQQLAAGRRADSSIPSDRSKTARALPERELPSQQNESLADALREKTKYEQIWKVDEYRQISPGLQNLEKVQLVDRLRDFRVRSILDAGCGSGKLMQKLITEHPDEFEVRGFDISANCLDPFFDDLKDEILTVGCLWDVNDFGRCYDAIVCTDVLEHIPTRHVPQVLSNFRRCTRKVCYLAIALFHDGFGPKLLGEPLHLTVNPPGWWLDQFAAAGLMLHAQGLEKNAAGQDLWLHSFLTVAESCDDNAG